MDANDPLTPSRHPATDTGHPAGDRRATASMAAHILSAILSISALVLQSGCLTEATLKRAGPYNCSYTRITHVTSAALSSKALFITFQVSPSGGERQQAHVLSIPLDDSSWLHDKRGKPVAVDKEFLWEDTQVHHVANWFLLPENSVPADARELRVSIVQTDKLERLPEKVSEVSGNVQVLSVKYEYPVGNADPDSEGISQPRTTRTDPLIAIMSRTQSKGWQTALIIADVCEGCEQDKGWYLLTPIAAVGDVVTLPLKILAYGVIELLGAE
jgi:hypothetical protein